jgi:hypothetical protein
MNKIVRIGLGAAAVVALLVGAQLFDAPSDGVGAESTPSPEPYVESTLLTDPPDSECIDLDAGTYHAVIGTLTVRWTMPANWSWSSFRPSGGEVFTVRAAECWIGTSQNLEVRLVHRAYADACIRGDAVETDTPAELTAALAAQTGHETTGPSEVTLGGYAADRLELTFLGSGPPSGPCADAEPPLRPEDHGEPAVLFKGGEYLGGPMTVYVVDIGGRALAVVVTNPGAEMEAVIDSLVIEP